MRNVVQTNILKLTLVNISNWISIQPFAINTNGSCVRTMSTSFLKRLLHSSGQCELYIESKQAPLYIKKNEIMFTNHFYPILDGKKYYSPLQL